MNAFRTAVAVLRHVNDETLQSVLQHAVALGDTLTVAAVLAEMNARAADVHDFEAPGYSREASESEIAADLEDY
jgi:hypothetical protein